MIKKDRKGGKYKKGINQGNNRQFNDNINHKDQYYNNNNHQLWNKD